MFFGAVRQKAQQTKIKKVFNSHINIIQVILLTEIKNILDNLGKIHENYKLTGINQTCKLYKKINVGLLYVISSDC